VSTKCADDKAAFAHPAPFLIKDIERMISMFTKKEMYVLDPFMGSGTTAIASFNLKRKSIGIDLSHEYHDLAVTRFNTKKMVEDIDYSYIVGDSLIQIDNIPMVDYIVTSPPYFNILRNKSQGLRADKSKKGYRNGSRQGVEYYSNNSNDLGNLETYGEFLKIFQKIMIKSYNKLKNGKYCSIIISDFTVDKKEISVQSDIVNIMEQIGFIFVGTIALLQDNKPLYPFGYPFKFKINHMHQNIINFLKEEK
jgi:DNA modification methylase